MTFNLMASSPLSLPSSNAVPASAHFQIVNMTPEMAQAILEAAGLLERQSKSNEKANEAVRDMVRELNEGRYKFSGLPITISITRKILAGRDMLYACIDSQQCFPVVLVEGIDDICYRTTETGNPRRLQDHLTSYMRLTEGDESVVDRLLTTTVNALAKVNENGAYVYHARTDSTDSTRIFLANPDIADAVRHIQSIPVITRERLDEQPDKRVYGLPGTPSVHAMAYYLFSKVSPEKANYFFQELYSETPLPAGSPIGALRRRLISDIEGNVRQRENQKVLSNTRDEISWIFIAWAAFLSGKKMEIIKSVTSRKNHPKVAGWVEGYKIERTPELPQFEAVTRELPVIYPFPQIRLEYITPQRAKQMLEGNRFNRKSRPTIIARYAHEMAVGLWHFNGETIKISKEGLTLDAQHRLYACLECRIPFYSLVVYGIDHEVFLKYDKNRTKGLREIMASEDYPQANILAPAYKLLWHFENDSMDGFNTPNPNYLMEFIDNNRELIDSLRYGRTCDALYPSGAVFIHHILSKINEEMAENMMDSLTSCQAEGLEAEYWAILMKNLRTIERKHSTRRDRNMQFLMLASCVIAWNMAIEEKKPSLKALENSALRAAGGRVLRGRAKREFPKPLYA